MVDTSGKRAGKFQALPEAAIGRATRLDQNTRYTHILCTMASKTISLRVEAYEKLRRARTHSRESFSEVVMRARWDEQTVTGGELLALVRERGALYESAELEVIDEMKSRGKAATDKWSRP